MIDQLDQMSEVTDKGRHAVVILDGAGWHINDIAEQLSNVSIVSRPPFSFERNNIEQVWCWRRQHYQANQSLTNYGDIVNKICGARNRFLESTECVKRVCTREWIELIS